MRLRNEPAAIDCQQFIAGSPANRVSLFINGEEAAGTSLLSVETSFGATGPASVVRRIDHPDMACAARALGKALGLSGFCGFDFMVSNEDGRAYLLEANPRLTPGATLAFAGTTSLPATLFRHFTGCDGIQPQSGIAADTVAFFPDERGRYARSPYLEQAHHDVPWDEPEVVKIGMKYIARRRLALRVRKVMAHVSGLFTACAAWLRNAASADAPAMPSITPALPVTQSLPAGHQ